MVAYTDLSAAVRAKVKEWLDLQPRGIQTRMAEFVGVKSPALSNYLTGKRPSMRADNIGRIVQFVRIHAPELARQIIPHGGGVPQPGHQGTSGHVSTAVDPRQLHENLEAQFSDLNDAIDCLVRVRAGLTAVLAQTDTSAPSDRSGSSQARMGGARRRANRPDALQRRKARSKDRA